MKSSRRFYADPLVEAYNAYEKSIVLDPKGGMTKTLSINNVYPTLGNDFIAQAIERFQEMDYEGALKSFEYNMKVAESDLYPGTVDTNIIYNAGLAAFNAKLYDKALEYLGICTTTKFEGTTPFLLMYQTYVNMENTDKAERMLQMTFEAFPEDQDVILQLVQFYLNADRTDKAFEYILIAKEKDPTNFSLYWAEGVLQMQQEKYDEAIVALGKSIELKSDFFDTQYNMGVCYYNKGSDMNNKANEIMDNAKYRAAKAEADEVFKKGLPYMEAALKIKPDDLDTMKSLKEIYYRLQMTDKYNEMVKLIEGRD